MRMTAPFLLRRRKVDPDVLPDLPPRQDSTEFCTLTVEQAALYQATIDAMMADVRGAAGIERRGHVLALITRLKQVCNHPLHALGKPRRARPAARASSTASPRCSPRRSPRATRALVFTQYAVMGGLLAGHVERELEVERLYLDGSTPRHGPRAHRRPLPGAGRRPARARHVAARRRARPQPDGREPRLPLRPLVEPGRRGPGLRPRPPHRPDAGRPGAQDGVRRHDRGADRRADRGQARPGRADRRPRRRVGALRPRRRRARGARGAAQTSSARYTRPHDRPRAAPEAGRAREPHRRTPSACRTSASSSPPSSSRSADGSSSAAGT